MSFVLGFGTGIASLFVAILGLAFLGDALSVGYTIECRCGYITGDFKTTPRWRTWIRWFWHKRIAHPLGLVKR